MTSIAGLKIFFFLSFYLLLDISHSYRAPMTRKASTALWSAVSNRELLSTLPPQITEIEDMFAVNMINLMKFVPLQVSSSIASSTVVTSYGYSKPPKATKQQRKLPPIVLLHGFDSSCLEYRRLIPPLSKYFEVYAPDILGWGFTSGENVIDFSPRAKLLHLQAFLEQVVREPCILVGASLGGGIAINLAVEMCKADAIKELVLIDAQGFIDGQGPSKLPQWLAKIGIAVLKSKRLRKFATNLSYRDKKTFATDEALKIGSVHTSLRDWDRASVNFLLSGGFVTSPNIPKVSQDTLVIWGANDEVIEPKNAYQFEKTLPSCTLKIIEECGHVPHIEKGIETAEIIKDYICSKYATDKVNGAKKWFAFF